MAGVCVCMGILHFHHLCGGVAAPAIDNFSDGLILISCGPKTYQIK